MVLHTSNPACKSSHSSICCHGSSCLHPLLNTISTSAPTFLRSYMCIWLNVLATPLIWLKLIYLPFLTQNITSRKASGSKLSTPIPSSLCLSRGFYCPCSEYLSFTVSFLSQPIITSPCYYLSHGCLPHEAVFTKPCISGA